MFYEKKIVVNILFVCGIFLLMHYLIDLFYYTDDVIISSFYGKYSDSKIATLIEFRRDWYWLSYLAFPIIFLLDILIVSSVLYTGFYLSRIDIKFLSIFNITLISQLVFIVPEVIKFFWFIFNPVSFENLRNFQPLSLFSLFDAESLQEWLFYPFKVLNVFEVVYWILLAFLLAKYLKSSIDAMLKIVLGYYVSFLFCWVVFVMFISLGNS